MNRAERRKQERFLKKNGKPINHLHSKFTQKDLDNIRDEIKDFLKTYEFKGSAYEESYKTELGIRKFKEMLGSNTTTIRFIEEASESIFTIEQNYPIQVIATKEIIKTDIFLIKEENGWFIKYDKLPFVQNLLITIKETTLEHLLNQDVNVGATVYGYMIPQINHIARKALDRLTLRYASEWVNL